MTEPVTVNVPRHWRNEIPVTEADRLRIALLRMAGCQCELPLLGCEMNGQEIAGPRCRLCNTRVRMEPQGGDEHDARADRRAEA